MGSTPEVASTGATFKLNSNYWTPKLDPKYQDCEQTYSEPDDTTAGKEAGKGAANISTIVGTTRSELWSVDSS